MELASYIRPVPLQPGLVPPSASDLVAIEVEVCGGTEDGGLGIDSRSFTLTAPESDEISFFPREEPLPRLQPEFEYADLEAHSCDSGLLTYQVPSYVRVSEVAMNAFAVTGELDQIVWRVPG